MQIRVVLAIALCFGGAWSLACGGDTPSAASAPGTHPHRPDSGAPVTQPPPPPPPPPLGDAGEPTPAHDAGPFELDSGQLVTECEEITAIPFIGEDTSGEYANAIETPADLGATRILATWSGSCDPAAIKIEMSDGDCPDGKGHQLSFLLDALAIQAGTLGPGIHDLLADGMGSPIQVRYVRPAKLEPVGEWGTCEGVTGTLSISGEPGVGRLDELQALFEMKLAPCDGSGQATQTLRGTFHVMLRRALVDVCPASAQ